MEKQQKKQVKKYISWALIAAITATLAFLPMIAAGEEPETGPQASILSAEAENREISTSILGGGTLTAEDAAQITIPAADHSLLHAFSQKDPRWLHGLRRK